MPSAVARTSTFAHNNATLPFVLAIADKGVLTALGDDPNLRNGLNVFQGEITHPEVAKALGIPETHVEQALGL
jgi:alanine dehydrogenase